MSTPIEEHRKKVAKVIGPLVNTLNLGAGAAINSWENGEYDKVGSRVMGCLTNLNAISMIAPIPPDIPGVSQARQRHVDWPKWLVFLSFEAARYRKVVELFAAGKPYEESRVIVPGDPGNGGARG